MPDTAWLWAALTRQTGVRESLRAPSYWRSGHECGAKNGNFEKKFAGDRPANNDPNAFGHARNNR